jgi:hypothetical protein
MERFLFHAEAYALTGQFTLPFEDIIPVQAMATLPVTGGFGSVEVEDYNFRNLVRFRRATASVSGGQSKQDRDGRGPYVSRSTIEVEGVNVVGMVTAERVFATVSTSIPFSGGEASLYVQGGFENLRVAGSRVEVDLEAEYFNRFARWSQLKAEVTRSAPKCLALPVGSSFRSETLGFKPMEIAVPNFGKVSLGELFVSPNSRRISMIRIVLGCPEEGGVEIGGSGANGVSWP